MTRRGDYTAGAMLASLAAGPAFLASLALAGYATASTAPIPVEHWEWIGGAVFAGFVSLPFGFAFALIPNVIGSWALHALGKGNPAVRLHVFWALVGAGIAGLPFALIPNPGDVIAPIAMAFAVTGASCALVARRFTRWA